MTTRKFSDPAAAQQTHQGPLDCYIDLFAQRLSEQQFSPESVRAQVLQVANLSRWLHARKLKAEELTVTAIDAHCREQRPGLPLRQGHRAALHRLLGILRERGVCPEDVAPSTPEIGALIEASEKACALRSRESHALTIVRARAGAPSH
jgi:hypothetical protein